MNSSCFLTYWSALSACGLDADAFRSAMTNGNPLPVTALPAESAASLADSLPVPGFDIRGMLGKKGTRSMDRATALAVVAIKDLISTAAEANRNIDRRTGIVLGTTAGSIASTMRFTRDSLTEEKPYHVDPAKFPNTVMNCAAGCSAIWHDLKGPNATVAGGEVAALLALNYGRRLLAAGRADSVIVGAVEELSAERARVRQVASPDARDPISEGAAAFLLDRAPSDTDVCLELLAPLRSTVITDDGANFAFSSECEALLQDADVSPKEVWAVSQSGLPLKKTDLAAQFPDLAHQLHPCDVHGDAGAANGALQLAALMNLAELDPASDGQSVVVLAHEDGVLVGAALRIHAVTAR